MQAVQQRVEDFDLIYEKVKADSRFSLRYLRAVDATVDMATNVRNEAQTAKGAVDQLLARLSKSGGYAEPLDPKNTLATKSASAEKVVKKVIDALRGLDDKWEPRIAKEHAEQVFESNAEAIGALQELHDAMVDLRWAVIEHDADLEKPKGKAFTNVEKLFADLQGR